MRQESNNVLEIDKSTIPSRILHTMLRVNDLDRSIDFYENRLGMKIFSRETYTEGRFTLIFMGYGELTNQPSIELTYNWDTEEYQHGTRYGHLALEVVDLYGLCDRLVKQGVTLSRTPGRMNYAAEETGHSDTIAFIEDPDGYKVELIQG